MQFNLPQPSILPLQPIVCQKMLVRITGAFANSPSPAGPAAGISSPRSQPLFWAHLNLPCWIRFLAGAHGSSPELQVFSLGVAPAVPFPIPAPPTPCAHPRGGAAVLPGLPGLRLPVPPALTLGHVCCRARCHHCPASLPETHPFRDLPRLLL